MQFKASSVRVGFSPDAANITQGLAALVGATFEDAPQLGDGEVACSVVPLTRWLDWEPWNHLWKDTGTLATQVAPTVKLSAARRVGAVPVNVFAFTATDCPERRSCNGWCSGCDRGYSRGSPPDPSRFKISLARHLRRAVEMPAVWGLCEFTRTSGTENLFIELTTDLLRWGRNGRSSTASVEVSVLDLAKGCGKIVIAGGVGLSTVVLTRTVSAETLKPEWCFEARFPIDAPVVPSGLERLLRNFGVGIESRSGSYGGWTAEVTY